MLDNRKFATIGVPIDCNAAGGGTELGPDVFRTLGLPKLLNACDLGNLPTMLRDRRVDPVSGIIAFEEVCAATEVVRSAVFRSLSQGHLPVLMGGCCTQIIGAVAAMRDYFGRVGLAYLDGHIDLYDGYTTPTGEAADIPLAVLLGRGPEALLKLIGAPVVAPGCVALVGYRDHEEAKKLGSVMPSDFGESLQHWNVNELRRTGLETCGEMIAENFLKLNLPFMLQIDVDILDQEVFAATDYLMPGGLDSEELLNLMRPIIKCEKIAAIALSCYNPEKDIDNASGNMLVSLIAKLIKDV